MQQKRYRNVYIFCTLNQTSMHRKWCRTRVRVVGDIDVAKAPIHRHRHRAPTILRLHRPLPPPLLVVCKFDCFRSWCEKTALANEKRNDQIDEKGGADVEEVRGRILNDIVQVSNESIFYFVFTKILIQGKPLRKRRSRSRSGKADRERSATAGTRFILVHFQSAM